MTHPDEGALQALADGELAPPARAAVEAHLAACADCAAALARLRHEGARASALLGVGDVPAPVLAAQAAFHRRRRGTVRSAAPAAGLRRALPRAAVLVMALAGAAAAAVVPGSPVRDWVGALGTDARDAVPEPLPPAPPPPVREREPAPRAVSIAPADGRVRVAVTASSPELRVRVRLSGEGRAEVTATGAAAGASFRTAPGRIEVVGAGPGELVVLLPADAPAASVEVDGRVLAAQEGGVLRALAPRVAGSAEEPVFRAGS